MKSYLLTSLFNSIPQNKSQKKNTFKSSHQSYNLNDIDSLAINLRSMKYEKCNTNTQERKQSYDLGNLDLLAVNLR